MKLNKTIISIIAMIILFTSCSSVYVTPNDMSEEDIVNADEYFTTGSLYREGDIKNGYLYEGCWIYMETQWTTGPCGEWSDGRIIYGDVEMRRIAKYNPVTGAVSSPCLDPVCNHSFESGCIMLAPHDPLGEKYATFCIDTIIGDWMVIKTQYPDDEFGARNTIMLYNLKTGESKEEFNEILGGNVVTLWEGRSVFEDKIYKIKKVLDLSETDYIPGGEDQNIYDYSPKTVYTFCEYDLETQTLKELFEVPEGLHTASVTNKRFFFGDDEYNIYSCNRDGSNMKKEDVLNFAPENKIGTYAYKFSDIDGFTVYDLKTNTINTVTVDFDEYMQCVLTEDGVLFEKVEGLTSHREFVNNREQFFKEHSDMDSNKMMSLYNEEALRLLYSGKTQILKTDLDGKNMRLIFEEENTVIYTVFATPGYVFAVRSILIDPGRTTGSKCVINIETGEITEIPFLDIVVPDWYVNP